MRPFAGEQRRRKSNRPGNSQANGPLGCVTLWKAPLAFGQGATEGEVQGRIGIAPKLSGPPDRGGSIVAVRMRIVGLPFLLAGCP